MQVREDDVTDQGRIVVADDDADIRRLVTFVLRRRGYEVVEATDGDEALTAIRRERPDLAVLDVMMPGLTGPEVTHALATDPGLATTPVILLSAKGQASEVAAGLASGARAYLVKPFAPRELAASVEGLLAAGGEDNGGSGDG
jgi:DNA-binding response OmpR family regulator